MRFDFNYEEINRLQTAIMNNTLTPEDRKRIKELEREEIERKYQTKKKGLKRANR